MAEKSKSKYNPIFVILIILMALGDLALLIRYFLQGKNIALFNPKGIIANQQLGIMMLIVIVLVIFAIPTLFALYFIAWKYRENSPSSTYFSEPHHSKYFVMLLWFLPSAVIISLGFGMWTATHKLSPQKTIAADVKPITVQVISLRWKWLFIYPEQKIATVNFLQIPVDTPVRFELTADESPMSSFWIPNLGGQIYAMTSHVTPLNLMANTLGDFPGSTTEINGSGFAGMKFTTRVSSAEDFAAWVLDVKRSPEVLSSERYSNLLDPSEYNSVEQFSSFNNEIFDSVVAKYIGPSDGHGHNK